MSPLLSDLRATLPSLWTCGFAVGRDSRTKPLPCKQSRLASPTSVSCFLRQTSPLWLAGLRLFRERPTTARQMASFPKDEIRKLHLSNVCVSGLRTQCLRGFNGGDFEGVF